MIILKKKRQEYLFLKPILKQVSVLITLTSVCLTLTSCSVIKRPPKEAQEIRTWWGNKQEIVDFLNSPSAKADRWVCEAIGE